MATPAATVMIDRIVLTPTEEVQLHSRSRRHGVARLTAPRERPTWS